MNNTITLKQAKPEIQQKFMTGVYRWMVLALAISGVAAYAAANLPLANGQPLVSAIFTAAGGLGMWVLIIAQLVLVFTLSSRISKMSTSTAKTMFFLYSLLNGITLSTIFIIYTESS
ncbi:MAG TPA: Bax inhibitor-1 family protein, partial [Treponemataceae bacterium]|nr:Bax inhibitor-1 family protein [Treponemataceae bacterium]